MRCLSNKQISEHKIQLKKCPSWGAARLPCSRGCETPPPEAAWAQFHQKGRWAVSPCNHLDKYMLKEETSPVTLFQLGTCHLGGMCPGSVSGRASEQLILLILPIAITIINTLSLAAWGALAYSPMYRGSSTTDSVCCLPLECFQLCSVLLGCRGTPAYRGLRITSWHSPLLSS